MTHRDATSLPDLFPPEVKRGPISGFVHKHPAIVIGGGILLVLLLVAISADWLGTIDPEKISPAKRNRGPSEMFWFGTDTLGGICIHASSTARASRFWSGFRSPFSPVFSVSSPACFPARSGGSIRS